LRAQYPWLQAWKIDVSEGFTSVLSDLFAQIEIIFGNPPHLDFLYLLDEVHNDEPFQRKLLVFIEATNACEAQSSALNYFVTQAAHRATRTCPRCGDRLEYVDNDGTYHHASQTTRVLICKPCAALDWEIQPDPECETTNGFDAFDTFEMDDDSEETEDGEHNPLESESETEAELEIAVEGDSDGIAINAKPLMLRVYSLNELDTLETELTSVTRDREKQMRGLIAKLKQSGNDKQLVLQPSDWRQYCAGLLESFPNFSSVITFISHQMALSANTNQVLALPPFLLMGPPGIGKTEFLLTLTEDMCGKLEVIDMSTSQSSSALAGSEAFWANTQTGVLFNTLALGKVANPILLLDEIDKARRDESYNALSALHQLLEPRQAKAFKDLSIPTLTLDASHVIWAATGNNLDSIEKPILDRFSVFEIDSPTKEQMYAIAKNQYLRALERYQHSELFEPILTEDVLTAISRFTPRQARKILESAIGCAAFNQRHYLTTEDIKQCSRSLHGQPKAPIGFI
jgi:ATP-dependent Lon protease